MLPDCSRRGGNYDDKRDESQKTCGEGSSIGAGRQAVCQHTESREKGVCMGWECFFSCAHVQIRNG